MTTRLQNLLLVVAVLAATTANAQEIRQYDVAKTNSAPTIDGVLGDGEWDNVARTGDFTMLRLEEGTPDEHNIQMAASWDDEALYVLVTSDYDGWIEGGNFEAEHDCTEIEPSTSPINCSGINFGGSPTTLNWYFDPNLQELENEAPGVGYQIAHELNRGQSSYLEGIATSTAVFMEGHTNNFGNPAGWGLGDNEGHLQWSYVANVGDEGGVVEMRLPWTAFDAPEADGVLLLEEPPAAGDTWFVNLGLITSDPDNFLPIWSWNSSQSFVTRPDGEWTFVEGGDPCDLNGDGVCDYDDLETLDTPEEKLAFLTADPPNGLGTVLGDVNLDFAFNPADLIDIFAAGKYDTGEAARYDEGDYNFNGTFEPEDLIEAFASGNYDTGAGANAVPEPGSALLALISLLGLMAARRK